VARVICAYIGFDELFSVHEAVGNAIREAQLFPLDEANTLPLFGAVRSYSWKLVFLPLAAGIAVTLVWAFRKVLDRYSLFLLCAAGTLFLLGAVGFETVEATGNSRHEDWNVTTAGHSVLLVEETLETAGMTVAVFVLAKRAWLGRSRMQALVGQ